MYWPEFLTAPFRKSGGIFGVGMAALAVVFGVIAFGLTGLGVLVGVGVVLLCAELWRDAAKQAGLASAAAVDLDAANAALELEEAEVASLREEVSISEAYSSEIDELKFELANLRSQASSLTLTPQQLIVTMSNQLTLVDLAITHRQLNDRGPWPVVRASRLDDGAVLLEAYVRDGSGELDDEWLAMTDDAAPGFVAYGQVMFVGERATMVRYDPNTLPPPLVQRLDEEGAHTPNGVALLPGGLTLEPYRHLDDAALAELRARLVAVSDSISGAITAHTDEGPQELTP